VKCRGIRGAITVEYNTRESILAASKELVQQIIAANKVNVDDIAAVWFTTTSDLNAEFPAVAARELGLSRTALLCGHEMDVPGSLPYCLRVMMLVNTDKKSDEIIYVYLKGAEILRGETNNIYTGDNKP
jgi:chorismate mutase